MNRWKEHSFKPISRMQVGMHALCALEPARRVARGGDHAPPNLFPLGPAPDWRSAAPKRVRHPGARDAGGNSKDVGRDRGSPMSSRQPGLLHRVANPPHVATGRRKPPGDRNGLENLRGQHRPERHKNRPVRYSTPLLALDTQLLRTGQRDQAPGRVCCLPLQR